MEENSTENECEPFRETDYQKSGFKSQSNPETMFDFMRLKPMNGQAVGGIFEPKSQKPSTCTEDLSCPEDIFTCELTQSSLQYVQTPALKEFAVEFNSC